MIPCEKLVLKVLTFGADALVVVFAELMTRASVFTWRRVAGDVVTLAVLPGVSARAHASAMQRKRVLKNIVLENIPIPIRVTIIIDIREA